MDIRTIDDIIIPTKSITTGTGWEEEIFPVIKGFSDFYSEELILATSISEIEKSEQHLETVLPDDLKLFYLKFGSARLMETLLSVDQFEYLSNSWDKSFLDFYNAGEQEVISKLITFGDYIGNGNLWCFHKDSKKIFYYKHDCKPNINGMFDTFYDYLKPMLIYSQGEMGQDVDGLEEKVQEIITNLIGKDRVRVWQYFTDWE